MKIMLLPFRSATTLVGILVLCIQACHSRTIPDSELLCSEPNMIFKMSLYSQRNESGVWNTQIRVTGDQTNIRELYAKAKQTTAMCNCTSEVLLVETEVVVPPAKPGSDYELIPNLGYYKLHTKPRTWSEAHRICCAEGTHLAIANSPKEATHIGSKLASVPHSNGLGSTDHLFSGFHDMYTEGYHITVLGEHLDETGYSSWSDVSQLDNKGGGNDSNADCGSIRANGTLDDVPCDWKLAFVCEQQL